MPPVSTVRRLAAFTVLGLAVACSKDSTGPSDLFAGSWNVTVQRLIYNADAPPDTGTVTPAPFALTIAKSGQSYTATWPGLTWNVTVQCCGAQQVAVPNSAANPGSVTVSGDTLVVQVPWADFGTGCVVDLTGTFNGRTASGAVHVVGGQCGTVGGAEAATGTWTATQQ